MEEEKQFEPIKAGFLKNKDGSFSDKYLLILIISMLILLPSSIVSTYWAFKQQPLPQYALELMKDVITNFKYIIVALIGCQSVDNLGSYGMFKKEENNKRVENEKNNN